MNNQLRGVPSFLIGKLAKKRVKAVHKYIDVFWGFVYNYVDTYADIVYNYVDTCANIVYKYVDCLEQHSRNQNAENLKSWPCGFFNINSCKINNYDVKFLKTRIKNKKLKDYST